MTADDAAAPSRSNTTSRITLISRSKRIAKISANAFQAEPGQLPRDPPGILPACSFAGSSANFARHRLSGYGARPAPRVHAPLPFLAYGISGWHRSAPHRVHRLSQGSAEPWGRSTVSGLVHHIVIHKSLSVSMRMYRRLSALVRLNGKTMHGRGHVYRRQIMQ
jgi:hypothetical protein